MASARRIITTNYEQTMNENNFQKRYSEAPKKIQDFLISEELTAITKNIVVLAKLDINQTTQLTEMIGNVLLGQLSQVNFSQEIESNLKVSPSQARIIIELANKKIFKIFEKELSQYKYQTLKQSSLQEKKIEETIKPTESPKIEPTTPPVQEKSQQSIPKQVPPESTTEPIIPKYSFPEPSEVKVEKPVSKIEELKKIVTPKVSSEQQEKIREKLLAAMQKKDVQPEIVEKMKKVSFKKPAPKEKKEPLLKKKSIGEVRSSEILGGEGKKFKDEEAFVKTKESKKEKPYILDVKLKEEKEREKESYTDQEPIPYKKYRKENPFGQA